MSQAEFLERMRTRSRFLLVVLGILAGLVPLGWRFASTATAVDARPRAIEAAEREVLRESELRIDDATRDARVRSALAPPAAEQAADGAQPGELFPNVISGHVVVRGGLPGAAAGTRVRCTPSLGTAVDCTVDARDRFEARGLPAGRAVLRCLREGHWAEDATVVIDESTEHARVEITLHPVRTVRIWIDDANGRPLPCDEMNLPLHRRLSARLMTGPEQIGAETDPTRSAGGLVSNRASSALLALGSTAAEQPNAPSDPEPWTTLEFVQFQASHLSLTLATIVVDSIPIPAGARDVHLRFDPRTVTGLFAELEIDVEEEGTRSPVTGIDVFVGESGVTDAPLRVRTDSYGRARVPYVCPRSHHVSVEDGDFLPATVRVEIETGATTSRARLVLKRGARIEGRVEWPAGGTGPDARFGRVVCRSIREGDANALVMSGYSPWRSVTTRDRFEFKGLAPGRYVVELYLGSDSGRNPHVEVDTRAGSVRDVVLKAP